MEVPLEITFRHVEKSDDMDRLIREKSAKLEKICDSLISCRVAVESPHARQQTGKPFRVRINMRVPPGHDLVVRRESTEGFLHERLPVVITDAFEAAFRQLKKLMDKQQGQVKTHPEQEKIAFVYRLFPEEDYDLSAHNKGGNFIFIEIVCSITILIGWKSLQECVMLTKKGRKVPRSPRFK